MLGLKTIEQIKVIKRFNHILFAFLRLGLGYLVYEAGFSRHIHFLRRFRYSQPQKDSKQLAENLRKTLEVLGPIYVKFGQILSTRSDFLPLDYIKELEQLQSKVLPFSYQEALYIIEKNFEKPINQIYKTFGKKPFASASLGQVYKASLKTGEQVAVKVQRPGAKEQIKIDIKVLYIFAHLVEKYLPSAKDYNLKGIIDEFTKWTMNELDYRKEAANCEIFSDFFKEDTHIYGPKVYWDYSTESVLTLEYVDGYSLNEVIAGKVKVKRSEIAHRIADAFIKQCFDYGFFHADPHPGNIFVIQKEKLMFLDLGMVGFLDNRLAGIATSIFLSLLQKDIDNIITLFLQIEQNYNLDAKNKNLNELVDVNALRKELNQLIIQWPMSSRQSGGFTKLFYELMNAAIRNGISVPTDLVMLSKAIVTLDRVILDLDPKFNLAKWEEPLVEKIIEKRLASKNIKSKTQNAALVFEDLLQKLPESSAGILANLEKSRMGMELNHEQLLEYERLLNTNSKLSTYGTLLAAVVIAAALVYDSVRQPVFGGLTFPQIVLIGAGILITIFFISNFRKGK